MMLKFTEKIENTVKRGPDLALFFWEHPLHTEMKTDKTLKLQGSFHLARELLLFKSKEYMIWKEIGTWLRRISNL